MTETCKKNEVGMRSIILNLSVRFYSCFICSKLTITSKNNVVIA